MAVVTQVGYLRDRRRPKRFACKEQTLSLLLPRCHTAWKAMEPLVQRGPPGGRRKGSGTGLSSLRGWSDKIIRFAKILSAPEVVVPETLGEGLTR